MLDDEFEDMREEVVREAESIVVSAATQDRWEKVPAYLKSKSQWVAYRLEERLGDPKPTKVPYYNHNGHSGRAEADNPLTWNTFNAVAGAAADATNNYDGIGYEFNGEEVGIDLDHCVHEVEGKLVMDDWARTIAELVNSYTEYSPSGTGVHIIVKGRLPGERGRKIALASRPNYSDQKFDPEAAIEMYGSRRYFTMTGHVVPGTNTDVKERQFEIDLLHKRYFQRSEPPAEEARGRVECVTSKWGADYLMRRMVEAANGDRVRLLMDGEWEEAGYESQSEADLSLCSTLAFWTGRDFNRMDSLFRKSGLYREKWDEWRGDQTYGEMTIETAISGCDTVYAPKDTETPIDTEAGKEDSGKFHFATLGEIMKMHADEQLVQGFLEMDVVSLNTGESETGKSFIWLSIALAVAAGIPWLGRKTKQGHVIYVYTEGTSKLFKRLEAWRVHHNRDIPEKYIHFVTMPVNLSEKDVAEELCKLADTLDDKPVLIVFDTLRKCAPGVDENSAKEVGPILDVAGKLKYRYGCHVSLIHHPPKNGDGYRGSSVLENDTDARTFYKRSGGRSGRITISCQRTKDTERFKDILVELKVIDLDLLDSMGDKVPSCVVRLVGEDHEKKITHEEIALEALKNAGRPITYRQWLEDTGLTKDQFNSARSKLVKSNSVAHHVDRYYPIEEDIEDIEH